MPLFVTVTPGTTISNSTTLDAATLNLLGTPAVDVVGTVDGGSLSLSAGSVSTSTIATNAVTYDRFQQVATDRLIGRDAAGTGNVTAISLTGGLEFSGGDAIRIQDGTSTTTGVTYAKIQNTAAGSRLIGRAAATAGTLGEISIGTGLALSTGGVLSNTATGKYYKSPSALFLPSLAGAITAQAHSLGAIPNQYTAQFIYSNATASAAGYVNGDVVEATSFVGQAWGPVCALFSDATYLYLRMNYDNFIVPHKTTGVQTGIASEITAGNRWKFQLSAVLFP